MDWKRNIHVDPERTRKTMGAVVIVLFACAACAAVAMPMIYAFVCYLKGY